MPVRPISATFFFRVHSFYEYVQFNQSNTRDRKNFSNYSKLFSSMLFSFSPHICFKSAYKELMMALCLKQYCDSWAAKPCFRLFTLYFRQKMRLLSDEKLFFGQQILLAENVVKGPAQNKFGSAYWYHLSLVTKNIIKVDLI